MAATKPRDLTPAGTWVGTTLLIYGSAPATLCADVLYRCPIAAAASRLASGNNVLPRYLKILMSIQPIRMEAVFAKKIEVSPIHAKFGASKRLKISDFFLGQLFYFSSPRAVKQFYREL